jgi:hypothetical protein
MTKYPVIDRQLFKGGNHRDYYVLGYASTERGALRHIRKRRRTVTKAVLVDKAWRAANGAFT